LLDYNNISKEMYDLLHVLGISIFVKIKSGQI